MQNLKYNPPPNKPVKSNAFTQCILNSQWQAELPNNQTAKNFHLTSTNSSWRQTEAIIQRTDQSKFNRLYTISERCNPIAEPKTGKYGPKGMFQPDLVSTSIPGNLATLLASTANFSLARSTWSTYNTALSQLKACSTELNQNLDLPLSESQTLTFVGWLLEKDLKASTIESYLAGLRQGQIAQGLGESTLRTPLVNQVISGRKNQLITENSLDPTPTRMPVTPKMLLLIKKDLITADMDKLDKLLIWSACTIMFYGAFRGGEILPKKENSFDPAVTLLNRDVLLTTCRVQREQTEILQICLKTDKTNRTGQPSVIDIYRNNSDSCPIAAWKKWVHQSDKLPDMPVFRRRSGSNFTCENMNAYLRSFNAKYLNIPGKTLSCHSFRAGLPTMLGKLGYSDTDIKATGRWSSRSYELYCKLPRTKRLQMAKEIASFQI